MTGGRASRGRMEGKQGPQVASIAFDSSEARDVSRPPISLHPAFPAVVALWFAALLGLGSMVLPVVLIERVVDLTGIAALVPAASPPLGFMARGLLALASAVAGAVLGIAIARRVARAHDAERPSRIAKFARGARRPIDIHAEIGGEGLVNGLGLPISRRRALAIAEDDRPSDFLYMAPLPGNAADDHGPALDDRPEADAPASEPFELSDAFEDAADFAEPGAFDSVEPAAPDEDPSMTVKQEFQPLQPEPRAETRQAFQPAPGDRKAEPLAFSAPSLARRAEPVAAVAPEPEPEPGPALAPAVTEPAFEAHEPPPFRGDWSSAPLGELGLVQLVQRLGASLERRREWVATMAPAAPAPPLAPAASFEPAPAEEAAEAMAAYFGKPAGEAPAPMDADDADDAVGETDPAALAPRPNPLGAWPAADDDDDELDAIPSFTLPLHKRVAPTIAFDDEPAAAGNDDDLAADEPDPSYSSLLAMRNPFGPKTGGFVRIDEPEADDDAVAPAVVFPGHDEAGSAAPRAFDAPAGSGATPAVAPQPAPDADAALRAALATLQRMSGTA